jgi:mRNA interferase HicA
MKRSELLRYLHSDGCGLLREGGRHSWWHNRQLNKRSAIPRHSEINDTIAKKICRDLGVLGTGDFVARVFEEAGQTIERQLPPARMVEAVINYIAKACKDEGVPLALLRSGARGAAVSRCRSEVARYLVEEMGLSLAEAARQLGVCTSAIWHAVRRARQSQLNEVKDVP